MHSPERESKSKTTRTPRAISRFILAPKADLCSFSPITGLYYARWADCKIALTKIRWGSRALVGFFLFSFGHPNSFLGRFVIRGYNGIVRFFLRLLMLILSKNEHLRGGKVATSRLLLETLYVFKTVLFYHRLCISNAASTLFGIKRRARRCNKACLMSMKIHAWTHATARTFFLFFPSIRDRNIENRIIRLRCMCVCVHDDNSVRTSRDLTP